MSANKPMCRRCDQVAETYNFDADSTFWGHIQHITETTVVRKLRVFSTYYRRNPGPGSDLLRSDEELPLCGDCWGDLVGRFMRGRDVPALTRKGE